MVEQVGQLSKTMADLAGSQQSEFTKLAETIGTSAASAKEVNTIVNEVSDSAMQVAQNAVELASGTDEVSSLVATTANRVRDVSGDMARFADYADRSSADAADLNDASKAIQRQAERLADVTSRYRL